MKEEKICYETLIFTLPFTSVYEMLGRNRTRMTHRRSLLTLPPELIYMILDNLDIETITLIFCNVCARFQTIP